VLEPVSRSGLGAMLRGCWASAADLKFLHRLLQARAGKSKAALETYTWECAFPSEVRVGGCCHAWRTSEAGHSGIFLGRITDSPQFLFSRSRA